ncbi:OmpA family protein [Maribacter sp. 2-571]|uniref:OmpA family protein n=1 Tax=Maribacter sp. 2-571 TaxID=3417569 RepID=UPI003D32C089
MKTVISSILCTLFAIAICNAQDKKVEKAGDKFDSFAYAGAIDDYESLVEKGYTDEQIFKNLGDANYKNADYDVAADWYSRLFKLEGITVDPDYMYRYAQSLKSNEEYEAARAWMQKYEEAKASDRRAKVSKANPDYLEKIKARSGRYEVKSLSVNSPQSDFAPSFDGDNLVFSTARDSGITSKRVHLWNNSAFLNLYSATPDASGEYTNASKLSNALNKKTHESSTAFTKDGTTVYFTRNNSNNGRFSRDDAGVSRLKIYRANLDNGNWTNIIELPFNDDSYSAAHPTLSPDESKLYFASDMLGSVGQSDIFVVDLHSDGSIGVPKNLGNEINTEGRETFPYVTDENVLYFASDGHPGLGGLDVFATSIKDLDNLYIINVGKPINSEEDDFSFIINEETKKGFFASNREGGQGGDDIYAFTENDPIDLVCHTMVKGTVTDDETGNPMGNAKVAIFNRNAELVSETLSNADGSFMLEGDCKDGSYKVVATKEEYNDGDTAFEVVGANNTEDVEVRLKKTIKQADEGTDLIAFLKLEPVYFDLDKADIRPDASRTMTAVIEYMNTFPDIKVQVQSHTDAKASTGYNSGLSKRRAKNTVAYLIANGIDASRVSGEGFGESQLTNECNTRESCPDERHQENRRSEFIVVR